MYLLVGIFGFLRAISNFISLKTESFVVNLYKYLFISLLGLNITNYNDVGLILAIIYLILSISSVLVGVYILLHSNEDPPNTTVKTAGKVFSIGFVALAVGTAVFGIIPCVSGPPDGLCFLGAFIIIPPLFVLISIVGLVTIAISRFRKKNRSLPPQV